MPVAVGVILLLVALAVGAYVIMSNPSNVKAGVECNSTEQLAVHYHAQLNIVYKGTPFPVSSQIGITPTCFYWLHTHDTTGVIHIEAPDRMKTHNFTLGDFFDVWGQPFDSKHLLSNTIQSGDQLQVFVQKAGEKTSTLWTGDVRSVPLLAHETITIEVTPPQVPTTPYGFPGGL